jgi:hypothetical protein
MLGATAFKASFVSIADTPQPNLELSPHLHKLSALCTNFITPEIN